MTLKAQKGTPEPGKEPAFGAIFYDRYEYLSAASAPEDALANQQD